MTALATPQIDNFILDPTSPLWGDTPWPKWLTEFRPHQIEAMVDIVDMFDSGIDVVLLDAPTGTGKTSIGEGVRRMLGSAKTAYCPDSKDLQDQFMSDFGSYARLLKGRANYPTADNPKAFTPLTRYTQGVTAADCNKKKEILPACGSCTLTSEVAVMHCSMCHPGPHACPYEKAKVAALSAELSVLNAAYFVTEANGPGMFSKRDFVIFDEADTLESVLMGQIEVSISANRRTQLGLDFPAKKTVEASWIEWVNEEAIPKVAAHSSKAAMTVRLGDRSAESLRWARYCESLLGKLKKLREALNEGNAVYDGYDRGEIRFQPVTVAAFAPEMIWRHGKKFLLMSATFIDAQETVDSLGIERAGLRWGVVKVDSTFPAERRPIHIKSAANMIYKEKEVSWPKMAAMVERVLEEKHPQDRVLVHTVSYAFTSYLADKLNHLHRPILSYTTAGERAEVLAKYKALGGSVLLAPSMDRGVSLNDDLCRAVIVTKMPYANMKDKRVIARMYGKNGQTWFQVQTLRKLIQMTGRGMRSEDDSCDTWILDTQFAQNVHKKGKNLLPKWWSKAIDWSGGGL